MSAPAFGRHRWPHRGQARSYNEWRWLAGICVAPLPSFLRQAQSAANMQSTVGARLPAMTSGWTTQIHEPFGMEMI